MGEILWEEILWDRSSGRDHLREFNWEKHADLEEIQLAVRAPRRASRRDALLVFGCRSLRPLL